jgi:hypothetical protein
MNPRMSTEPCDGKQKICFDEEMLIASKKKLLLSAIRRGFRAEHSIESDGGEVMFRGMGAHGGKF